LAPPWLVQGGQRTAELNTHHISGFFQQISPIFFLSPFFSRNFEVSCSSNRA
jgi:hypothetical protein